MSKVTPTTTMTGDELKARRLALGMSQLALARALDIGVPTVWSWEHGVFPVEKAKMLSLALDAIAEQQRRDQLATWGSVTGQPYR